MPYSSGKILVSWSGGKDSAMALHEIRKARDYEVCGLVTGLSSSDDRVPQNKITRELICAQAEQIGLPVYFFQLPEERDASALRKRYAEVLAPFKEQDINAIAFGDLFLDDVRDRREDCFDALGFHCEFPLWQRCTKELSLAFINAKFKAVVTRINCESLSEDFLCRTFDRSLLSHLPVNIDPCGENGEFYTFVFDGPIFANALDVKSGKTIRDGNTIYCEIVQKKERTSMYAKVSNR